MKVLVVGGFLGAGKTSAIRSLARHLGDRGERVAVITNDQGQALVDTELVRPSAEWVREIGGGCFCCRYDELRAALAAARDAGATIAIAEAVGSCTDLIATVLSPLAVSGEARMELLPLTIVVDPWRLRDIASGAFSEDVAYLFEKQIAEADVIVTSRADLGPPDIQRDLRRIAPGASHVSISSVDGRGLAEWVAARPARPAAPLDIDYDRYAAAEASLGWLNARAILSAAEPFDPAATMRAILEGLRGLPIAHLKLAVPGQPTVTAAIVRRGGEPTSHLADLRERVSSLALLVNARMALAPLDLEQCVRAAVERAAEGLTLRWEQLASFEPGRPVPTHRHTFRCGSGDDASCCSAFYDRPDVRYLLGDSLHPGGTALSLQLARELRLAEGARVLDVACGGGATLRAILDELPVIGVGLDAGVHANGVPSPSTTERLSLVRGDAHAIPFEDAAFDGVLCECALSTFADPRRALAEIARVTRPGGRVVASDMIVEGPVPDSLAPYAHTGACIARARTREGWRALFMEAGFAVEIERDESGALRAMLGTIKRRLLGVALAKATGLLPAGVELDVAKGRALLREADATVAAGAVGYGAWVLARRSAEVAS